MKFFSQMADQLKIGKNNLQCRSHHQKMMKRYESVEKIIEKFMGNLSIMERKVSVTKVSEQ